MRRRRINPFLAIVLTAMLVWYAYLGHQLVALTALPLSLKLIGWLVLSAPFGAVLWLPFFHWREVDPTPHSLAVILALASHLSLGFLSFLLLAVFFRDLVWLVSRDSRLYDGPADLLTIGFAAGLLALGHLFARLTPHVKRVRVAIEGLPAALHGYRIVQLSDMHIGATTPGHLLDRIVERVNALEADAVVLTGDIFEGDVAEIRQRTEPLARLKARDGRFFVTGNHEYYWGADQWLRELPGLGLTNIGNRNVSIERAGQQLVLAGVDDAWGAVQAPGAVCDPAGALNGAPASAAVRILLSHQPKVALRAAGLGYALQLSGHTHGGQFIPWVFFAPLIHGRFFAGLSRYKGMWVYVSRGTGSWGPPIRLGSPTEITLLELVTAAS